MSVAVHTAEARDRAALVAMRTALWPPEPDEDHAADVDRWLRGESFSTLPMTMLIAQVDGEPAGFAEVGLRSHADGCDPRWPVGYLEGWFVHEAHRRRGVGRALVDAALAWARDQGCREFASDTWRDAQHSIDAHLRLGFEVVDRCVNFRRDL